MIIIDHKDARPIYEQVVDKFQKLILTGVLEPNTRMPSVRSLAVDLSINPNTIQRAYAELERQGFIYTVKGRGNFVAYDERLLAVRKEQIFEKLQKLVREAAEIGIGKKELTGWLIKDGMNLGSQGEKEHD
ncbi:MAG TPA: GntR family transcriptional regulator [Candidatus Eisenbergiella merdipullorum]|uniref:GntR family transcriptional regulator n=1 Tax=Candidatus Eisenbergiella merdipullorum TaxID=2838553 RepID=A0A9D2I3C8_9FIRM|nr:GntR family transcriptional regulator [Candidatus Eisenbergiella merdipullorum]